MTVFKGDNNSDKEYFKVHSVWKSLDFVGFSVNVWIFGCRLSSITKQGWPPSPVIPETPGNGKRSVKRPGLLLLQGSYLPGKPGKTPVFCLTRGKPGKLREICFNPGKTWENSFC